MTTEDKEVVEVDIKDKSSKGLFYGEDENKDRGNWSGKLDFLLSCLGYAVGLGNVWRFPYLAYKNGGGVFFIPYCIMLFFVGMPIFLLELTLGQFSSCGTLTCWSYAWFFKGIGIAMMFVSAYLAIYYNVVIAWAMYYFFASFGYPLPWKTCGSWSSELCQSRLSPVTNASCIDKGFTSNANGLCYNGSTIYGIYDTAMASKNGKVAQLPASDYMRYVSLQIGYSTGLDNMGPVRWELALCLLLAWIIVTLSLLRGVKTSGKVVYFTAIFPYIVLVVLLIRGVTLEGYYTGILFYIKPNLTKLSEPDVWKDAAVQIFFSLSASYGGLITLSSYNRFHNDVVRDTLIVTLGNCLTSLFAGFVVFSFLGHLSHITGTPVESVAETGPTLIFVVYAQAVSTLPVETLWSILFFMMVITLGLDTQFALLETISTGLTDQFPVLRKRSYLVIISVAVVFYLLGLVMCTPGGPYMLTIMDDYSGGWNLMLICILEALSISYVYGFRRFANDIEAMVGKKVCFCIPWFICKWWWIICWAFFTWIIMAAVMVYSWVGYTGTKYDGKELPAWNNALGWLMTATCVLSCFVPMFILPFCVKGSCLKRMLKLLNPTGHWGPALPQHRYLITYVPGFVIDPKEYEEEVKNRDYQESKKSFDADAYYDEVDYLKRF